MKMKMKTKITAFFLAAVILLSFTACGKADTNTTTTVPTSTLQTTLQETSETVAQTTTEPVTTEPVTAQPQSDARTEAQTTAPAANSFTKAKLAEFDGQNGRNAYIAYDGVVYDVTDEFIWKSGGHKGLTVGTDLTEQINSCSYHLITFIKATFSTYPEIGTYNS